MRSAQIKRSKKTKKTLKSVDEGESRPHANGGQEITGQEERRNLQPKRSLMRSAQIKAKDKKT